MPLTLIATPGAPDANAYQDIASVQAIMDATPNSDAWGTDPVKQTQVAIYGTAMLDALGYLGVKASVAQALQWPRGAVLDPDYGTADGAIAGYMVGGAWGVYLDLALIPKRILRGHAMLCLEIMRAGPADVWGVDPTLDVQREQVDVLATDYVAPWFRRVGLRRYPSVWREIYPLTAASGSSVVERA